MLDNKKTNFRDERFRIHSKTYSIISRSIDVILNHCNNSLNNGILEESTKDGFLDYIQSFSSVLALHHKFENEIAFPYFKDKIPNAPYDMLINQHNKMDSFLQKINILIANLKYDIDTIPSLMQLKRVLMKINEIYHPHSKIEDGFINIATNETLIDVEKITDLKNKFLQSNMENLMPDYITIPFQFYNLSPQKRSLWSKELPEEVTKQLIPIDWKDKWTHMKPFLLE